MEQFNPMIEPKYEAYLKKERDEFAKFSIEEIPKIEIEVPALIFGCGVMTHEQIFLHFKEINEDFLHLYDPDPFKYVPEEINVQGKKVRIYKKWDDIKRKAKKYKSVVCFFSLHYVPNWLDKLWELHEMLSIDGKLFISEDKGFRALLDFNYNLKDSLIREVCNDEIITKIWRTFLDRRENGVPWYPDISAGNIAQVREILSSYYIYDSSSDKYEYILLRKYIKDEINYYLPWIPKYWYFDKSNFTAKYWYPDLDSLNIEIVPEKILIYKLTKRIEGSLPPLWDLKNEEFINNIWPLKLMHCHRAMVRNSPTFELEKNKALKETEKEDLIIKFINGYLVILYQHLLRHLPGGVAEFVSLAPKRFYEFHFPQMHKDKFFQGLPTISWEKEKYSLSEIPDWYNNYITQLLGDKLPWAGEYFLVQNTGSLNYLLKGTWKGMPFFLTPLSRYYCAHFYNKEYCDSYGFICDIGDWNERKVKPCIYITVQAARGKKKLFDFAEEKNSIKPYSEHFDLKYVGFVLYLPSADIGMIEEQKYVIIGSLISHLLAYSQSQVTTVLAVTALDIPVPHFCQNIYKGVEIKQIVDAYNKIFPERTTGSYAKQHAMNDITIENTKGNINKLNSDEIKALEQYLSNIDMNLTFFQQSILTCKLLKAVLGRNKDSFYLFDLYLYILKKYQKKNILNELESKKKYLNDRFPCKSDYAFWYAIFIIEALLNLGNSGFENIHILKNSLLVISKDREFPVPLTSSEGKYASGSFGDYLNMLRGYHNKLFHREHIFWW